MCNTYCLSMAKMAARTRLNVTLYVRCLSYCAYFIHTYVFSFIYKTVGLSHSILHNFIRILYIRFIEVCKFTSLKFMTSVFVKSIPLWYMMLKADKHVPSTTTNFISPFVTLRVLYGMRSQLRRQG
jgi:hypothetical protein